MAVIRIGSAISTVIFLVTVSAKNFEFRRAQSVKHENGIISDEFVSQHFELDNGAMIFTKSWKTPIVMPTGDYAITGFWGEIVDENNNSVPLSTVYTHHWIAVNDVHKNELCNGGPEYVFGIGAESRNNPITFPSGYGHVVTGKRYWGANLHLLHTEGLAGDNPHKAAKECNECYYAEGKGDECTPKQNGTFQCCGETDYDGTQGYCPVAKDKTTSKNAYALRYVVNYTRDVDTIKPLKLGVLTTPNCATYYEQLRNDDDPESLSRTEFEVPKKMTVRLAVGHVHTGALNISIFKNDEFVCTSKPRYGTEDGVVGNERGYLVEMSHCIDESTGPLVLEKGDKVRLDAYYYVGSHDPRLAYSDGTHLNVMAYMYVGYE